MRLSRMSPPKKKKIGPSYEDEKLLWKYFHRKICVEREYEEVNLLIFTKYIEESKSPFTPQELQTFYSRTMVPGLYNTSLPEKMIYNLYNNLQIEMLPHIQSSLERRFESTLIVDPNRHLVNYNHRLPIKTEPVDPDEQEENGETEQSEKSEEFKETEEFIDCILEKPTNAQENTVHANEIRGASSPLNDAMWYYIGEHFSTITAKKLISLEFWEQLISENGDLKNYSPYQLLRHFQKQLAENMPWQGHLETQKKLKLIKEMYIPMSETTKQYLWTYENVQIELSNDLVVSWKFQNDERVYGESPLPTETNSISSPKTPVPEQEELLETQPLKQDELSNIESPRKEETQEKQAPNQDELLEAQPFKEGEVSNIGSPRKEETQEKQASKQVEVPKTPSPEKIDPLKTPSPASRTLNKSVKREPSSVQYDGDTRTYSVKKLESDSIKRRGFFKFEDDRNAWKYIIEQLYDKKTKKWNEKLILPKGKNFWKKYIENTGSEKSPDSWTTHYRKQMCPKLHEMRFNRLILLHLYARLDIQVTKDVHRLLELKCGANIELNANECITSWQFNDEQSGIDDNEDDLSSDENIDDDVDSSGDNDDKQRKQGARRRPLEESSDEKEDDPVRSTKKYRKSSNNKKTPKAKKSKTSLNLDSDSDFELDFQNVQLPSASFKNRRVLANVSSSEEDSDGEENEQKKDTGRRSSSVESSDGEENTKKGKEKPSKKNTAFADARSRKREKMAKLTEARMKKREMRLNGSRKRRAADSESESESESENESFNSSASDIEPGPATRTRKRLSNADKRTARKSSSGGKKRGRPSK